MLGAPSQQLAALEAAKAAAVAVEDFLGAAAIKERIAGLQRTNAGAGAPAPSPSAGVPGGGARDEEGAGAPLLFTLTHPLDALRPVSLPGGLGGGFGGGFGGGLTMRATGGVGTGGCMGGGGGGSGRGAAAGQEGAERVVWAGRRPGWPLAVLVTRSGGDGARRGRRTVWGLRRLRAEGIDGDR